MEPIRILSGVDINAPKDSPLKGYGSLLKGVPDQIAAILGSNGTLVPIKEGKPSVDLGSLSIAGPGDGILDTIRKGYPGTGDGVAFIVAADHAGPYQAVGVYAYDMKTQTAVQIAYQHFTAIENGQVKFDTQGNAVKKDPQQVIKDLVEQTAASLKGVGENGRDFKNKCPELYKQLNAKGAPASPTPSARYDGYSDQKPGRSMLEKDPSMLPPDGSDRGLKVFPGKPEDKAKKNGMLDGLDDGPQQRGKLQIIRPSQ
jgi:hypothetical protein